MKTTKRIIILIIRILLILTIGFAIIMFGFIKEWIISFKILSITIILLLYMVIFKELYKEFLTITRKLSKRNQKFTIEELEIIEDAKKLIKSVDESIILAEFNVYKVKYIKDGWFYYDEETKELNIFIPFNLLKKDKNLCFLIIIHEILNSQNLKDNQNIFKIIFLEGLNQLLTIWLVEKYSNKYKIPEKLIANQDNMYILETKIAKRIIKKHGLDLKEIFLKYIEFDPEFFRKIIPKEYFKKR